MSKEYIQIAFDFENQDQLEILVAQLSNLGFDGFNEEEAATSINNGVGMSSVLGTSAGLGKGAGHCKTFILQQDYMVNNIENELNNILENNIDDVKIKVSVKYKKMTLDELDIEFNKTTDIREKINIYHAIVRNITNITDDLFENE